MIAEEDRTGLLTCIIVVCHCVLCFASTTAAFPSPSIHARSSSPPTSSSNCDRTRFSVLSTAVIWVGVASETYSGQYKCFVGGIHRVLTRNNHARRPEADDLCLSRDYRTADRGIKARDRTGCDRDRPRTNAGSPRIRVGDACAQWGLGTSLCVDTAQRRVFRAVGDVDTPRVRPDAPPPRVGVASGRATRSLSTPEPREFAARSGRRRRLPGRPPAIDTETRRGTRRERGPRVGSGRIGGDCNTP